MRLNQKLQSNFDRIPTGVSAPLVKLRSIDDVPVMALTLWGSRYDDFQLRLVAAQLHEQLKEVPDVSEVTIIGGRPRQIAVEIDPNRLAAYGLDPLAVRGALTAANARQPAAALVRAGRNELVQAGRWLRDVEDVRNVVVSAAGARPVLVRDLGGL